MINDCLVYKNENGEQNNFQSNHILNVTGTVTIQSKNSSGKKITRNRLGLIHLNWLTEKKCRWVVYYILHRKPSTFVNTNQN